MNAALLIGKHHSTSVPGKNYRPVLGRPLCEYPMLAAEHCEAVDRLYVSTDSPVIREIGERHGAEIIDRPEDMAKPDSPTEFVFSHAYKSRIREECPGVRYLVLMFANSPDVLPEYIEKAMARLDEDESLDSVTSVSRYNMFTPLRARRLTADGCSEPVLDLESLGIENTFDRDAMGDIYFVDFGVQVVRPERCLVDVVGGALPFRWLGRKQGAIEKEYGFDIDYEWQFAVAEHWLKSHGFSENYTPYGD